MTRYPVLATDYDGTLAAHGHVDDATWSSVERFKATGRKIVLVTGRELEELLGVCPRIDLFDLVVAENGAFLYRPSDGTETTLAPRPHERFVETLRQKGVGPISFGRVIVATWEPHRWTVEETIRELGLDLRVIPNKAALMVLPPGIDKASGLAAALAELGLILADAVAVANAVPSLKDRANLVTRAERGAGVAELIERIIEETL